MQARSSLWDVLDKGGGDFKTNATKLLIMNRIEVVNENHLIIDLLI